MIIAYRTSIAIVPFYWIERALDIFKCVIFFVLVKQGSWIQILSGADPAEETA